MKIPIQNIYYLLCYAWDRLEERNLVDVAPLEGAGLADLFAEVLVKGIAHLRRRGLDRGYLARGEDGATLRGKLDIAATLKRNLLPRARAHCHYDYLSYDVPHNRILKSTLLALLRVPDLDPKLKHEVADCTRLFPEVESVPLSPGQFRLVQIHRNNAFYGFLLDVCRIIADNLLVSQETGDARFRDFLQDESAMSGLFEQFVFNFFRREQSEFRVVSETISWREGGDEEVSAQHLPQMRTDISLISPERHIIMDTKFYREPLRPSRFAGGSKKVREDNLYQLFAYLQNAEGQVGGGGSLEGVLLYPAVQEGFRFRYRLGGHTVTVQTLDLNQDWRGIHNELLTALA